jgi:two-component system OmpR family sensor kinase
VSDPADVAILDDIVTEGERLQGIIGQMLAVARIENRGLFVSPSEVGLADLEQQIRKIHRRATLVFDDDIAVDEGSVITDNTTLVQLLASLVDNAHTHGARDVAIRVCRQLPFTPTLELSPTPPSALHFVVIDDGPGIDPDFLPRAFEKFEKDSRSAGTGLGLYLARMMADAIGASIAITSDSSGTAIAISVPGVPARHPVSV